MMITPDLYDAIETIYSLPEYNLPAGAQGTLVHQHTTDTFEVEFVDEDGETLALCPLSSQQFIVVWQAKTERHVPISDQLAQIVTLLPAPAKTEVLDFARFLTVRQITPASTFPIQ